MGGKIRVPVLCIFCGGHVDRALHVMRVCSSPKLQDPGVYEGCSPPAVSAWRLTAHRGLLLGGCRSVMDVLGWWHGDLAIVGLVCH